MPSKYPRLLVLTSSTGGGHDRRAQAFEDWVRLLFKDNIELRIDHILENGSRLTRFGVWLYNTIQRYAPVLHNVYWFVAEVFGMLQGRGLGFGKRYFQELLEGFRPHVILSVHDSANRGYFETAKRVLGDRVRCVTYCGEFSGGFGYSRIWISKAVDRFYSRTVDAEQQALALGLSPEKAFRFFNFLPPDALAEPIDDQEKRRFIQEDLGLIPERFTLFFATGAVGANRHISCLEAMVPLADRVQVIVICGRNEPLLQKVSTWIQRRAGNLKVHAEGFSLRVPKLLQVSNLAVARGGANFAAEATLFGCPILFHVRAIMPQERLTVRYFVRNNAGLTFRSARELPRIVTELLDHPEKLRGLRENIRALRSTDHPESFVRELCTYAADSFRA